MFQRFFGMIRSACGSNSHPDPLQFAQMYRLLSVYSLVQPPRGSNISGGDIVHSLIKKTDNMDTTENDPRSVFIEKLDNIVENGIHLECVADLLSQAGTTDQNDSQYHTQDFVTAYVSGYIARKCKKFTKCETCLDSLVRNKECKDRFDSDKLILLKSKGSLLYPSQNMLDLCSTCIIICKSKQ